MKPDRKQDLDVLYQFFFFGGGGGSITQGSRPGLWLAEALSTSPLKPLNGSQRNLTGCKISMSFTKFVFSGRSEKQDDRPCLWLADTFSTFPLKPPSGIQQNLTGGKISASSTKFVFWGQSEKKMAALASDWVRHFRLFLWNRRKTFNETWQEARPQLPLPSLCFFRPISKTRWPPGSDWLRHFRLLLWNCLTKFKETWQEVSSQRSLPSLYFSGQSGKQDGHLGLWLAETFLSSPLKPLNGIQRNLTWSKIATSSTKFLFFGPIRKTRWLAWPIHQKVCTLYSGARYMALWASCLCKQWDLVYFLKMSYREETVHHVYII